MKRTPASSNGRTPPFEGVNRGSTPRAGTITQSVDALHERACEIVGLTADIERIRRLRLAGEITDGAALHLLAATIYELSREDMSTAH